MRDQSSTRPSLSYTVCMVLASVLAGLGLLASFALTADDSFPDVVVAGVDHFTSAAAVIAVVLIVTCLALMKVRADLAEIKAAVEGLRADTCEIKGGLWQINNGGAVGRARVYQTVDREAATKVLTTAGQKPDEYTEHEWKIYMSGLYDGRGGEDHGDGLSPN